MLQKVINYFRCKIHMHKLLCMIFHYLLSITVDDFTTGLPFLACSHLLFLIFFIVAVHFFCFWHRNGAISQFNISTKSSYSRNLKAVFSLDQLCTLTISLFWRKITSSDTIRLSLKNTKTIAPFKTLCNTSFAYSLLHFPEFLPHTHYYLMLIISLTHYYYYFCITLHHTHVCVSVSW